MTNKEDEVDTCESRLAGMLAVHLVSQVLDEAYVIANAATESGQPWRYLEMLKNLRSGKLVSKDEGNISFCISKGDSAGEIDSTTQEITNVVATSTPQKMSDVIGKVTNNPNLIGQGDEEFTITNMRRTELNHSTSMFINHLFDMSEVEHVILCDDIPQNNQEPNALLTEAMTKIMESYVNSAIGIAFSQDIVCSNCTVAPDEEKSPSTEYSEYSFLTDAFSTEVGNVIGDIAFCVDEVAIGGDQNTIESSVIITEVTEDINEEVQKEYDRGDVARYENAFLTLNRDYDQCSEEDGEPILQDPKGIVMQEVELGVMQQAPEEDLTTNEPEQTKSKELSATSAVSASSRKSLVQRCRNQGARLLACLRGWWRRKTPGKRKEGRVPGSVRGLCPLSPDARRRAASLLDQSRLGSSPDRAQQVVWKFHTVSEALVNSTRWKNYTFEVNPDESAEF